LISTWINDETTVNNLINHFKASIESSFSIYVFIASENDCMSNLHMPVIKVRKYLEVINTF